MGRRDLLVPKNIREVKGSFFTPQIWVEKSQEYIAKALGDNWQEEYTIWDCAAGTGNLLAGLANKYNIWASTIDQPDVDTMKALIDEGFNLLPNHVFRFDFLNDSFDKLPPELKKIIDDPEKRRKLIIYINPPYAEAADVHVVSGTKSENKIRVSKDNKIYNKYAAMMGKAGRELFVQFLTRIYKEIPYCNIAEFSKIKALQSPNFSNFRMYFRATLKNCFIMPAYSFDNVSGEFPIGFKVWTLDGCGLFFNIKADVFDENGKNIGKKEIINYGTVKLINRWLKMYDNPRSDPKDIIGAMCCIGNDFQHAKYVNISSADHLKGVGNAKGIAQFIITKQNLDKAAVYYAVRHVIQATWINDRDQFLFPENDHFSKTFLVDCLVYMLFNNNISAQHGVNHWIPFTPQEVNANEKFESDFMSDIIKNLEFSKEAKNVLNSGLELWKYYHSKIKDNNTASVNASFYDIREFFQGRNTNGKMNNKSTDETYTKIIKTLRNDIKLLAQKIEPKVYEYGFLK
jgi:hypothetical protein